MLARGLKVYFPRVGLNRYEKNPQIFRFFSSAFPRNLTEKLVQKYTLNSPSERPVKLTLFSKKKLKAKICIGSIFRLCQNLS